MKTPPTSGRVAAFVSTGSLLPVTAALALGLSALSLTGCYARGRAMLVYDYPAYEVDTVPVEIVSYPSFYYRGSNAYLVDGRWYYQANGRWVVFRREPRELYNARRHYEAHPPPRRSVNVGHPPDRQYAPPPATRDHR